MSSPWFECRVKGADPEIFLIGEIHDFGVTAKDFIASVKALEPFNSLTVRLNSEGGSFYDGLTVYNFLSTIPNLVTRVDGLAASIASIIFMAAKRREMPTNAHLMIHNPTAALAGDAEAMRKMGTTLDALKSSLVGIYAKATGIAPAEIESMMDEETWLSGKEAHALHFATHLLDEMAIAAKADLSRFRNPPQSLLRSNEMPTPVVDTAEKYREIVRRNFGEAYLPNFNAKFESTADAEKSLDATASAYVSGAIASVSPHSVIPGGLSYSRTGIDDDQHKEALYARLGGPKAVTDNPWVGRRIIDIARARLSARGFNVSGETDSAVFMNVGLHTTDDLPVIFQEAGGRVLRDLYSLNPPPIKQVAKRRDFTDFKPRKIVGISHLSPVKKVVEHGQFLGTTLEEEYQSSVLEKAGSTIGFSIEALINDDLGAAPKAIGKAAADCAQYEASVLLSTLTGAAGVGPNLVDGDALFHTNHGNIANAGAMSATTFAAAFLAMADQKDINSGYYIANTPRFLLTGPKQRVIAAQQLAVISPTASTDVNPFSGSLTPLIEQNFGIVDTRWYLFADPATMPVLEYGHLSGTSTPQLKSEEHFDTAGWRYRVMHFFAAAVCDWRGAYLNPGA